MALWLYEHRLFVRDMLWIGSYIRLRDKARHTPSRVLGLSPTDPLGATGWQRPSQSRGGCHNIRRRR